MTKEIILTNALMVMPKEVIRGTLHIQKGLITGIDSGRSNLSSGIDLEGDYLLPGFIELHTDHLENQMSPRPGIRWPPYAAVLSHDAAIVTAGITTVFDALAIGDLVETSSRMRDLHDMLDAICRVQEKGLLRAEHLIHLRCEMGYPHTLEIFKELVHNPLVQFISLMDHTPGQRQFKNLEKMFQYYQGKYGLGDEELNQLMATRQEFQHRYASKHRREIIEICKEIKLPIASHDDTTADHVMEAASEGIILCEFPTTFEAAQTARLLGLSILMGAPNLILGRSHSGNVSAKELGEQGLLDILSSDYVPSSLIHGIFLLHRELHYPLPDAVAMVTLHPAQISNLHDRGAIEVGKRADLIRVRWDPPLPIIKSVWRKGQPIF